MADTPIPHSRLQTASWVLYDLANTIYSATITFLFALYVESATAIGVTTMLSMVVAGLATPLFAAVADRTGRAGAYCTVTTLGCIAGLSYFGIGTPAPPHGLLVALFFSNVCYQAALVFYNSMLPSVASESRMGVVSGLGVGLGYLGTAFTLAVLLPIQSNYGWRPAFFTAAGAFFIAALPCMLLVRDRRPIVPAKVTGAVISQQWHELLATVRRLPAKPALMWFLLANFFAVDVLNTAILFFGKFVKRGFIDMAESGTLSLFGHAVPSIGRFVMIAGLCVNVPALVFGLLLGFLADRIGSLRAFALSLASLAVGLVGAVAFCGWGPELFLIAMCGFGGLGLAGIWTAGRKLLVELVPIEHVGRYFGLYGITNKVSIIGAVVFGVLLDAWGPRAAIGSQVFGLGLAFACLWRMRRAVKRAP